MTEQQKINWKRSGDIPVLQDVSKGAVHMLQFPLLEQQSWISHGFSTRMGGVSEGCYAFDEFELYQGPMIRKKSGKTTGEWQICWGWIWRG